MKIVRERALGRKDHKKKIVLCQAQITPFDVGLSNVLQCWIGQSVLPTSVLSDIENEKSYPLMKKGFSLTRMVQREFYNKIPL